MEWLKAMFRTRRSAAAGWLVVATVFVGGFEGLRTAAYLDPVGIPTICFGETLGVKLRDRATKEECEAKLQARILEFNAGVNRCLEVELPESRRVAVVSLAYNIGVLAFCKSSIAKRLNAGDVRGGCDAFLLYDKARKAGVLVPLPGLTRRRAAERELCLRAA